MKHVSYPLGPRPDSRDDKPPPFMGILRVGRAYEASHIPAAILFVSRMALGNLRINSDYGRLCLICFSRGTHGLLGLSKTLLHIF